MTTVTHRRSPDEPEGGWMGPKGPDGWPDLEELNLRQRGQIKLASNRGGKTVPVAAQFKKPWEK